MIRNLESIDAQGFNGKVLNQNLTGMNPGDLLAANNIQILNDGNIQKAMGYKSVAALSGPALRIFDFERDIDNTQFVIVQHGGALSWLNPASGAITAISGGPVSTSVPLDFAQSSFILYGSDGTNAYRFVDKMGTLTQYNWGIAAPATAPTLSTSGAAFSLTNGRVYCYSYVSYYTDSLGIERMHIGAPSPLSAFSGPVASGAVVLGGIIPSTDPQVTNIWIFETVDAPINTQSTFYFAAEIANGTTTYADTLPDAALDSTRTAPFDNHPAPPSSVLTSFQSRIWALVPKVGAQFSSYSETFLGIPEESWPSVNFYPIPSGNRAATALVVPNQGYTIWIGTPNYWNSLSGYDYTAYSAQDRFLSPGPAGKQLVVVTPAYTVWLGPDRKLWAYNGIVSTSANIPAQAAQLSSPIDKSLPNTTSTNDLTDAQLANAVLRYFSLGEMHYIALFANTDSTKSYLNWMALWQVNLQGTSIVGLYQTDRFPSHPIISAANVNVNGTATLFLGDQNGGIYQWPSGYTDAGTKYPSWVDTAWLGSDMLSHNLWVDVETDAPPIFTEPPSAQSWMLSAIAARTPDMTAALQARQTEPAIGATEASDNTFSARLSGQATGASRYLRMRVTLPNDGANHTVQKISVKKRPIYKSAP